jgi:hypothetical protein
VLASIATWFADNPAEVTESRMLYLTALMSAIRGERGLATLHITPILAAGLGAEAVDDLFDSIETLTHRPHERFFGKAAIGLSQARVGLTALAQRSFEEALALREEYRSICDRDNELIGALIDANAIAPIASYAALIQRAMLILRKRPGAYITLMFQLWKAGDQESYPTLLDSFELAVAEREELRRVYLVHAHNAPRPVDAVLRMWRDSLPNRDQAAEQVAALARALAQEGDPRAEEITALL